MPTPSDPFEDIKKILVEWFRNTLCFPSWEEILEVEYVKRQGEINMFTDDVVKYCQQKGLKNAVAWYRRLSQTQTCPSAVFGLAVEHYSREHGLIDTWPDPEIICKKD